MPAGRLIGLGWQIPRLLAGWAATIALVIAFLYAIKAAEDVSRLWVGFWFVAGAATLVGTRLAIRLALGEALVARALTRRIAVIGIGEQLVRTVERLAAPDPAGHPAARVAKILDLDGSLDGRWPRGIASLRGFAELEEKVQAGKLDQVVIAMPARSGDLLERALRNLRHLGVDVGWVPDLPSGRVPVLGTTQIGDVPLVRLLERPIDGWHWLLKAVEDRVLAAILLLVLAPLMLLIALAVRLDTPGPVLYRQRRHGFSQQPIAMLKFRSMHAELCDPIDARHVRQATRATRASPASAASCAAPASTSCPSCSMSSWATCPWSARARTPSPTTSSTPSRSTTISAATASSPASPAGPRSTATAARPGPWRTCAAASSSTSNTSTAGPCGSTCGSWRARSWSGLRTAMRTDSTLEARSLAEPELSQALVGS